MLNIPGGSNSEAECQLPKLDVAGSIPVSRSITSVQPQLLPSSVAFPLPVPVLLRNQDIFSLIIILTFRRAADFGC